MIQSICSLHRIEEFYSRLQRTPGIWKQIKHTEGLDLTIPCLGPYQTLPNLRLESEELLPSLRKSFA